MSRKTNHYTHFGISFASTKPKHITLESFTKRERRQTSDGFFWYLCNKEKFKLFNMESMLEYYNGLLSELPLIKQKNKTNGSIVEHWCNVVLSFFNGDYEKEQLEYRLNTYEEADPKHEYTFEYFLERLPIVLERRKADYDWSNGSYFRPYYSEKALIRNDECLAKNYEINMRHFNSLSSEEFNDALNKFLKKYDGTFEEIKDLSDPALQGPGYYVLVLDDYKQFYIGQTKNICERIIQHWRLSKTRSRRIFGDVESSKISIDSFGPFDTTRIFVSIDEMITLFPFFSHEDELINEFDNKFITNRVPGGELPIGIDGINPKKISG